MEKVKGKENEGKGEKKIIAIFFPTYFFCL